MSLHDWIPRSSPTLPQTSAPKAPTLVPSQHSFLTQRCLFLYDPLRGRAPSGDPSTASIPLQNSCWAQLPRGYSQEGKAVATTSGPCVEAHPWVPLNRQEPHVCPWSRTSLSIAHSVQSPVGPDKWTVAQKANQAMG